MHKMHQNTFGRLALPGLAGGSLKRSRDLLAAMESPTSKEKGGKERKGKGGKGIGR